MDDLRDDKMSEKDLERGVYYQLQRIAHTLKEQNGVFHQLKRIADNIDALTAAVYRVAIDLEKILEEIKLLSARQTS